MTTAAFESFKWLKQHKGRLETRLWERWFKAVGRTRKAFHKAIADDPFAYNETAAVGTLASAASSCGFLALAEYVCLKRGVDKLSRRVHGRADLWVHDPEIDRSWSFEAKRIVCRAAVRRETLSNLMSLACAEANRMTDWESDASYGMVLVITPDGSPSAELCATLEGFADACTFACRLGGGTRAAYLYLRQVR